MEARIAESVEPLVGEILAGRPHGSRFPELSRPREVLLKAFEVTIGTQQTSDEIDGLGRLGADGRGRHSDLLSETGRVVTARSRHV
jgi:hypothetical protein